MSVNTTFPHCMSSGVPTGVLNERYWEARGDELEIHSVVGGLTLVTEYSEPLTTSRPSVGLAFTAAELSHWDRAIPFGNVWLMFRVTSPSWVMFMYGVAVMLKSGRFLSQ